MSKPSKKQNKPEKPSNEVIKDETKDGTDDRLYQRFLTEGLGICRGMEAHSLTGYWDIGALVRDFTDQKDKGEMTGRDLEQLAVDLGVTMGVSTLYFARKLNEKYAREKLPGLAAAGFGTGIIKICFGLKGDVLARVEQRLVNTDGSVVTLRELEQIVREETHVPAQLAIETTPTPAAARATRTQQEAQESDEAAPEAGDDTPDSPTPEAKADDGKTGSRGATPIKDFTHRPLPAFKAVESAATKLLTIAGDAIISATEVVKVGFDHPKAKDNARMALSAAHGAVRDLLEVLPDLESRLKEALEDVSG